MLFLDHANDELIYEESVSPIVFEEGEGKFVTMANMNLNINCCERTH
jgi:hypothetical protein